MTEENTVKDIRDLALLGQVTVQPTTDFPTVALPRDWEVHSLEGFMAKKNRFTGSFVTDSINALALYDAMQSTQPACFYSPHTMKAKMTFDLGTDENPGHGLHTAELVMKKTPEYEAVTAADDKRFTQQELFNWLQDWRAHVELYSGIDLEDEIEFKDACHRIRSIDIKATIDSNSSQGDFSAGKSTSAQIEMQAKEGKKLPGCISFLFRPYHGFDLVSARIQISIHVAKNDEPLLSLRIVGREELEQRIADVFEKNLEGFFSGRLVRGLLTK